MNVAEFEREARAALVKFPFLKRMEIVDIHREAIKLRLYAKENLFVQAYFNSATGTKNFVAILSNERIFGRDCDQKDGIDILLSILWGMIFHLKAEKK